ncbi:MAG: oxalurate catabolism protein HpxZ, partial [Rhizobacter sp.]
MDINQPDVLADVTAVFARYEDALVNNRVEVLDELFWTSGFTVRYGVNENLVGIDAIRAFRAARSPIGLDRRLQHTVITTYGRDFATAMTEFMRPAFEEGGRVRRIGRQSQTWARTALPGHGGWRVVAAHVSLLNLPE